MASSLGLDRAVIDQLNFDLALRRVIHDTETDFIFAPHLTAIYHRAAESLHASLRSMLQSGTFAPRLPLYLEVPKKSGFSRPGAILWPHDRLAYQAIVDLIAPTAERALDRSQVFSSRLLADDPQGFMFWPASEAYEGFKRHTIAHSISGDFAFVLNADVAAYFERLNQHVLINLLSSVGCNHSAVMFLERLLSLFTQKDSHGLLQGLAPSDFLGTFFLLPIDSAHRMHQLTLLRYVDDIRIFFTTEREAQLHLQALTSLLRKDGMSMNESKSQILEVSRFIREETEVDTLFFQAKEAARAAYSRSDFYRDTLAWDQSDFDDEEPVKRAESAQAAIHSLFDLSGVSPSTRLKINAFCVPCFILAGDDFALDYVLAHYALHPSLAQIYARYLKYCVVANEAIVPRIAAILTSGALLFEFQSLWLVAALMSAERLQAPLVDFVFRLVTRRESSEALRSAGALLVAKHGSAGQRHLLKTYYQDEQSAFVRSAILYSAHYFPRAERDTCFSAWGGHDEVNALVVIAAKSMGK